MYTFVYISDKIYMIKCIHIIFVHMYMYIFSAKMYIIYTVTLCDFST